MAFRSSTVVLQLGIAGSIWQEMRKKSSNAKPTRSRQSQEAAQSNSLRPLAVVVAFLTLAPSFVPAANKAEPSLRGPAVPWHSSRESGFISIFQVFDRREDFASRVGFRGAESPLPRQPPQQASLGKLGWVRDAGADLRRSIQRTAHSLPWG